MKIFNKTQWRNHLTFLILPVLLAGGLLCGGCSNDPVAPHDEVPALQANDVASQAGFVDMAVGIVGPQTVDFTGKTEASLYQHMFTGIVTGSIFLEFTIGSAPALPAVADHVKLYTGEDTPLIISGGLEGFEGTVLLTFDISSDLDRGAAPNTSTINGGGTFSSGPYEASFSFDNLVFVGGRNYPTSGSMTFSSGGFWATTTYAGANIALMEMSTGVMYQVNLADGVTAQLSVK
jgi:hypothetical protein